MLKTNEIREGGGQDNVSVVTGEAAGVAGTLRVYSLPCEMTGVSPSGSTRQGYVLGHVLGWLLLHARSPIGRRNIGLGAPGVRVVRAACLKVYIAICLGVSRGQSRHDGRIAKRHDARFRRRAGGRRRHGVRYGIESNITIRFILLT